jgi:hypothetical protein
MLPSQAVNVQGRAYQRSSACRLAAEELHSRTTHKAALVCSAPHIGSPLSEPMPAAAAAAAAPKCWSQALPRYATSAKPYLGMQRQQSIKHA